MRIAETATKKGSDVQSAGILQKNKGFEINKVEGLGKKIGQSRMMKKQVTWDKKKNIG